MTTTLPERTGPAAPLAESLLARLDDPRTAAALHDLLDHAELLALLVTMVDGLIRRSETLTDNLAGSIADVRASAGGATAHLEATAADLAGLLPLLLGGAPALREVLSGPLARPETLRALSTVTSALVEGLEQGGTPPLQTGVRTLLHELRDPATFRGLASLLSVARALGRR